MSLEQNIKRRIGTEEPVVQWIVEHATLVMNRCAVGKDGRGISFDKTFASTILSEKKAVKITMGGCYVVGR